MTNLKTLKSELNNYGYSQHWKLLKNKDIPKLKSVQCHDFFDRIMAQTNRPQCQNIDLIIPKKARSQNGENQLEQFLKIIGTEITKTSLETLNSQLEQVNSTTTTTTNTNNTNQVTSKREHDDEKRAFRIQEFIRTEQSYVETLKTLIQFVVQPLRATMQQKNFILNTFKCSKIFLNVEQIMIENEAFLMALLEMKEGFGTICERYIEKFECYRKYLLEQADAQQLHTKEFKVNQSYRRFLLKLRDQAEFKRKRLQDILVEPVQRISRYSMMLKDILCLTSEDHPDYKGLNMACEKAKIIATMADDNPTKIATLFLNLYQSIKDSPCSLINQKRSLITYLDAIEIHRVTNKPTRAVTLFLFTDKILVANRSSIDAKEIDINDLLDMKLSASTPHHHQSLHFKKAEKAQRRDLKFKGWADIESIELFNGPLDRPGSFILSASTIQEVKGNQTTCITSFEKYFYKGPRLFSVLPVKKEPCHRMNEYLEKSKDFIEKYQMSRTFARQYKPGDYTLYRQWQNIPTFCNVYSPESYVKSNYKNYCALIYVEENEELESLLNNNGNLIFPWIVGLIQPDTKGFRFLISYKPGIERPLVNTACEQTLDFESIFWNNLIFLDGCLKQSAEFKERQHLYIQQELINVDGRSIHRSRSVSRSNGAIGKLFNNSDNNKRMSVIDHRSRSVSPSKCVPTNSRSLPSTSVQQQSQLQPLAPVHSWSSKSRYTHITSKDMNSSVSSSLSIEKDEDETKGTKIISKCFKQVDVKHETTTESLYDLVDTNANTISSIGGSSNGSTGSCRSSFSIPDEKEKINCNNNIVSEYTITSLEPDMDRLFKPTHSFENEMQQQWNTLKAKYDLSSDNHSFNIVHNNSKNYPSIHHQNLFSNDHLSNN